MCVESGRAAVRAGSPPSEDTPRADSPCYKLVAAGCTSRLPARPRGDRGVCGCPSHRTTCQLRTLVCGEDVYTSTRRITRASKRVTPKRTVCNHALHQAHARRWLMADRTLPAPRCHTPARGSPLSTCAHMTWSGNYRLIRQPSNCAPLQHVVVFITCSDRKSVTICCDCDLPFRTCAFACRYLKPAPRRPEHLSMQGRSRPVRPFTPGKAHQASCLCLTLMS
jgi:hypothetical protein